MQQFLSRVATLALVVASACSGGDPAPTTGTAVGAVGSPSVTSDQSTYQPAQPFTITWADLPGNALDWIAVAPQGSPATTIDTWCYTGGTVAGMNTFGSGATPGTYVARAFANDGYDLIVESAPFTVGAVGLTTDHTAYFPGQQITVTWSGLPGNAHDWIAIALQGADPTNVSDWIYTGGATGGTQTFQGLLTVGTYVARSFIDDGYTVISESAPFPISGGTATVTTDTSTYGFRQNVVVTWSGAGGSATDWIALAPAGSPLTTLDRWSYTGGGVSSSRAMETPSTTGSFVARVFSNDTYTLVGESAAFTVAATTGATSTTTDAATYSTDQDIVVSWTGLQGVPGDWVAVAPAGSPPTTILRWLYAGSAAAGSVTFLGGLPATGSYVARTFSNDTYTVVQESTAFTVQ